MALALCCRFCNSLNCKALGQNTMCYDCGRLAENTLKLVPVKDPEPVVEPALADVTPAGTEPDPALVEAVAEAEAAGGAEPEVDEAEEDATIEAAADEAEDVDAEAEDVEAAVEDVDDFASALDSIDDDLDDEPAIEPLPEDSPLRP